jgi:penicillin G amidase
MRTLALTMLVLATLGLAPGPSAQQPPAAVSLATGVGQAVEIVRDRWGINHIYAQNETDLFFAQGYAAAKDRLFQFETWRRQATGTTAEILG